MWIDLIHTFDHTFYDSHFNLSELKKIGYTVLTTSLHSDIMIVIKNYQESNEIANLYIVSLCDAVSKAWGEIDSLNVHQDLLGSITKTKIFIYKNVRSYCLAI